MLRQGSNLQANNYFFTNRNNALMIVNNRPGSPKIIMIKKPNRPVPSLPGRPPPSEVRMSSHHHGHRPKITIVIPVTSNRRPNLRAGDAVLAGEGGRVDSLALDLFGWTFGCNSGEFLH